jgi:hypothetical protein
MLEDFAFQALYLFTDGGAVDDPRLTTLAPYSASADAQERGRDDGWALRELTSVRAAHRPGRPPRVVGVAP